MTAALLFAVLCGAEPDSATEGVETRAGTATVTPPADPRVPLERDAARIWYRQLAAKTTKRVRTDAREAVPQLVTMYVMVDDVQGLPLKEKARMKATLRGRLEWYRHRLRSEVADAKRRDQRNRRRNDHGTDTANGGGSNVVASSLIDLIQTTINPPIWDVNGGPAGIGYFAPLHALVVRAPGEVHYQLGDVLKQLHRIQQNQPQVTVGTQFQAAGNAQMP